jgi:hypothetical protein
VTRRNSILLVLVALAAMAGAYWMLILSPKHQDAAALNTQIAAKQAALSQAEAELASYETDRGAYRANYSRVARLGKAVPADDDVRSLLVQINSAADASKVDFHSISLGGGTGTPPAGSGGTPAAKGAASVFTPPPGSASVGTAGFATMPFSFGFEGSFFRLGDFFSRLDHFVKVRNNSLDVTGRLLLLNSITLQPDPQRGFPHISADVSANSYLLPPAQDLLDQATADAPTPSTPGAPAAAASPATTTTSTITVPGAIR